MSFCYFKRCVENIFYFISLVFGDRGSSITMDILIIGDSGVGKSEMVNRLTRNKFNPKPKKTMGIEVGTRHVRVSLLSDGTVADSSFFNYSFECTNKAAVENYF